MMEQSIFNAKAAEEETAPRGSLSSSPSVSPHLCTKSNHSTQVSREIIYLSQPEPVSMGDAWFDIASTSHFWIRRRFEVLRKLAPHFDWPRLTLAEIGSGSGLVQRQFEDQFGAEIDGFDLNETALQTAVSGKSRCLCYNIHARDDQLRGAYDAIVLFDVVEHIDDDRGFLESALFHLKPGGSLIINVPALMQVFSGYDKAAGHVRRYGAEDLIALVEGCGLKTTAWTYWGRPMLPLLALRKRRLEKMTDKDEILRDGFASRGALGNAALLALSRCERIPQHETGTSLMLIAHRESDGGSG
jgi:SAM-dependent methyltransferase